MSRSRTRRRAARWSQQAGEHFDSGGFTRAVGAEKAEETAAVNAQVYVIDGDEVTKLLDQ